MRTQRRRDRVILPFSPVQCIHAVVIGVVFRIFLRPENVSYLPSALCLFIQSRYERRSTHTPNAIENHHTYKSNVWNEQIVYFRVDSKSNCQRVIVDDVVVIFPLLVDLFGFFAFVNCICIRTLALPSTIIFVIPVFLKFIWERAFPQLVLKLCFLVGSFFVIPIFDRKWWVLTPY